eukprot:4529089-Pyramimonas_sp.AAC.2
MRHCPPNLLITRGVVGGTQKKHAHNILRPPPPPNRYPPWRAPVATPQDLTPRCPRPDCQRDRQRAKKKGPWRPGGVGRVAPPPCRSTAAFRLDGGVHGAGGLAQWPLYGPPPPPP